MQQPPIFTYNGQELEIDDSFVYLGTQFSYQLAAFTDIIKDLLVVLANRCLL